MYKLIFSLLLSLFTITAWADSNVLQEALSDKIYADCDGRLDFGAKVGFKVQSKADFTEGLYFDLGSGYILAKLQCQKSGNFETSTTRQNGWNCIDHQGSGLSVELFHENGNELLNGKITQNQDSTTLPKVIGTLSCK